MKLQNPQRFAETRRVTIVGACVNIVLAVSKTVVGLVGRSNALFADGIHSFSDLLTDLLVLFVARAGNQAPDERHPYGHARIETLGTMVVGVVLLMAAFGIIADSVYDVLYHRATHPDVLVILVALFSVLSNEFIFYYTLRVARRIHSNLLKANAWHHRSDSLSSAVVLVSVVGAYFGVPHLDMLGAIIVALMIAHLAIKMMWQCISELIDTGVDEEMLQVIATEILAIPGVLAIHQLRTRLLGGTIFVDVHIQVDARLSVSEGHYISEQIPKRLIQRFSKVVDVTVHVDIGEHESVLVSLPDRAQVREALSTYWCDLPGFTKVDHFNLHYIGEKVDVDVYLPIDILSGEINQIDLQKQYRNAVCEVEFIGGVRLFFC